QPISPRCADPRAGARRRRRPPEGPRMTRAPGMAFAALAGGTPQALAPAPDRDWNGWASHPMWGMWGMWSVWGLMMMLLMLVFWGLVIAGLPVALCWLVGLAGARGRARACGPPD